MATATGASDGDKYSNRQRRLGGINRKGKTKASSRRFNTANYSQEALGTPF